MTKEELAAMQDGDLCYYDFAFVDSTINIWKKRVIDGNSYFQLIESSTEGPILHEALVPITSCLSWLLFERCTRMPPTARHRRVVKHV